MGDEWWTRLDLHIPESIPEDLTTREACLRYVRKVCHELAEAEREYDTFLRSEDVDAEANIQAYKRMNSLRDSTAEAVYEAVRRMAGMEATRTRD
jgi:hypothetical protein